VTLDILCYDSTYVYLFIELYLKVTEVSMHLQSVAYSVLFVYVYDFY